MELDLYPGPECSGSIYLDDGHTFAYQKNQFLRIQFTCQASASSVSVAGKVETAGYQPWWSSAEVTIFGAASAPKEARIGDQVIRDVRYDGESHSVTVAVPDALKDWSLQLSY